MGPWSNLPTEMQLDLTGLHVRDDEVATYACKPEPSDSQTVLGMLAQGSRHGGFP